MYIMDFICNIFFRFVVFQYKTVASRNTFLDIKDKYYCFWLNDISTIIDIVDQVLYSNRKYNTHTQTRIQRKQLKSLYFRKLLSCFNMMS